MTVFQLRTQPAQTVDGDGDVLLDWFGRRASSTVHIAGNLTAGLHPPPMARDLLRVGGGVFCIDKLAPRADTPDGWTRELELRAAVSDPDAWRAAQEPLRAALEFLTGDHWSLRFAGEMGDGVRGDTFLRPAIDAVSLFSGGLDSLAGAVDLLIDIERTVLVGHHESPLTANTQTTLARALRRHHGQNRVRLRQLFLRPAAANRHQERPLPDGERENTTRGRSLLFIAAGLAVASAVDSGCPLYVPENGFIGINVPLTAARSGSLSTRTTHPYFMALLRQVLDALGLVNPIVNPYRLATKGEALAASRHPELLESLARQSISCAHPEASRWAKRPMGDCGYCWPCLIRRASLHRLGLDAADDYAWDALTDGELLTANSERGGSLRALIAHLHRDERPSDVLRNGPIPGGETRAFFDVYRRGRAELLNWLRAGAAEALRVRLP